MAITNQLCNVPFCWKLCKIKIVTTVILLIFALYLYGSWFQSQIAYLAPNKIDDLVQKMARSRFLNRNEFLNENDDSDKEDLDLDLDFKKNYAETTRKKIPKDFVDEEDQNEENYDKNEILDTKLYPKRKQELDPKEVEDIEEMSQEMRENYENHVFDRRLLKKKGRWEEMKKVKNRNFEKLKDVDFDRNKNEKNVNFKISQNRNFAEPKVGKGENFEKSNTFHENKNISKIANFINNNMGLKRRLPQCIIIGMRKAGTRALITFLELNSHIKAANKEVHFFDTDENYNKGFDWYKKQMPYSRADQITIEKTPRYVLEEKVPDRIYRMNSSIKLILIVKEPVLRAISEYAQNYARSKKNRQMTFEEYALKPGKGEVNVEYAAINRSIYYQHMPIWLNKFHRKQIHIVDGDELVVNPEVELNKIEKFLGLEQEINSNMFYFNKTKGFKCAISDELSEPICLGVNKGREHPVVFSGVIKKLQDFYRPFNKKFFKQVNQEFNWP